MTVLQQVKSIIVKDNRLISTLEGEITLEQHRILNWCAVQISRPDKQFETLRLTKTEAEILLSNDPDPIANPKRMTDQEFDDLISGLYEVRIKLQEIIAFKESITKNLEVLDGHIKDEEKELLHKYLHRKNFLFSVEELNLIAEVGAAKAMIKIKEKRDHHVPKHKRFAVVTRDIHEGNGEYDLRFSDDLKPYLLDLDRNFTKLNYLHCMSFKRKFTQRFYEKAVMEMMGDITSSWSEGINDLKKKLGIEGKYKRWGDFEKRVLKPVQEDLRNAGLILTYNPSKYEEFDMVYTKGLRKRRGYQTINFNARMQIGGLGEGESIKSGSFMQLQYFGFNDAGIKKLLEDFGKDIVMQCLKMYGDLISRGTFDSGEKIDSKAGFFRSKCKDFINKDKQLDMLYDSEQ